MMEIELKMTHLIFRKENEKEENLRKNKMESGDPALCDSKYLYVS